MKRPAVAIASAPTPCKSPTCEELNMPGSAYCKRHATERNHAKQQIKQATTSAAYRSQKYKRARRALLDKYGPQCWICSRIGKPPHAHHIDGNNTNNRLANLAVLCPTCHGRLEREIDMNIDGPRSHRARLAATLEQRNTP